jgi:hypothetical protein
MPDAHALPRAPRPLPPRLSPLRRARRVVVIACLILAIPVGISFLSTMTQPSNSNFTIRAFEWLRDHGAAGFASRLENFYYSFNAPSKGGPGLHRLPRAGAGASALAQGARDPEAPAPIPSLLQPALRGEGRWLPSGTAVGNPAPVLLTTFRSDPNYPRMVAGVAWIDQRRASVALYPGRQEPSVDVSRGSMEVPSVTRGSLVATFNSAFKLSDSRGGVALGGRTYAALQPGLATAVGYRNGRVDVIAWNGGTVAGPDVVFARQNLPLIVEGGEPNPNLSDGPQWGLTLGNAVRVWRSGLGVDRNGNLLYAAAPDQTVGSLAEILIRAGAVRAMELDINSYWVSFISYDAFGAIGPRNLLPGMTRSVTRYLSPDDRDFFAVLARS